MTIYYLYWIHHKHHTDPSIEGYIGVSVRPKVRFSYHSHPERNNNNQLYHNIQNGASQSILYEFATKEEAYAKEIELRPTDHIGWNIIAGGDSEPPKHYGNKFNLRNHKPRHTTEHKNEMSKRFSSLKWFNDGEKNIRCLPENVPEGFSPGRTSWTWSK